MQPQAAVRHIGPVAIVDLEGRLTLSEGCGVIRGAIKSLLDGGHKNILLNLAGISYIDSAGLGEMAGSYVTVSKLGGQLKLLHTQARVNTLLQVTKLYVLLVTFSDEAEAVSSFPLAAQ